MARGKKHSAEQVVNLLKQIEAAVENGNTTPQACKEVGIVEQPTSGGVKSMAVCVWTRHGS